MHHYDEPNKLRAIFVFYIDSQLRFDQMYYRDWPRSPVPQMFWTTNRPVFLTLWWTAPGGQGYFVHHSVQNEDLVLGETRYLIVAMISCDQMSEVIEVTTTNTAYSGDAYPTVSG
ncbi:uncharacterized protein LOC142342102 [Convolutriloba macropyga]|uniref:uncharacterized protein LOC142342102 n=1 Tax=Convolutriloba macropyga TaxID=536237 RepID=UPI003F51D454